jgi:hypothetical protein
VTRVGASHQVVDAWVLGVRRAEDLLGLGPPVGLVHVVDVQHGQHHALGIAQRELGADVQSGRGLGVDVERDRHGPQRAVRQPHVGAHALVLLLGHEPTQRGEAAVEQQLQVTHLTRGQIPRRPVLRGLSQFGGPSVVDIQVHEFAAVRLVQCSHNASLRQGEGEMIR